jgi:thioredoxin-related protein
MLKIKKQAGKFLVLMFSLTILFFAAFLLYKIIEKKRMIEGREIFTSLDISLPGNLVHTISAANHASQFIIMFFDPDCYYCHVEAKALVDHIDDLVGIKIYMLTTNKFDVIGEFEIQHKLTEYPQIITGRITEEIFSRIYGIKAIPSLMIYDEKGVLLFSNSGYTPVGQILNIIESKTGSNH